MSSPIESTITSGELFYRTNEIGKNSPGLNKFRQFLDHDIDRTTLQNEIAANREYLKKCRLHMRKKTEAVLKNSADLNKILKMRRNRAIVALSENEELIRSTAKEVLYSVDQRLMDIILMYGTVVNNEVEAQSANNREEIEAIEAIRRQEVIGHDLRVFAKYLNLESKGLMNLTFLDKDNEQYKRCKKAIKDNINSRFLRDGNFQGVRVLNICSLQNGRLASFLQTAVKGDEGGKVKGLFCAIPKKSVYSFCIRGLHLKKDDYLNSYDKADRKPSTTKKGCRVPVNVNNSSRKMFEWSWYCYPPPPSPIPPPNRPSRSSQSPRKSSRGNQRPPSPPDLSVHVRGVGTAMHVANESQPLQNDPQRNIRFTRSSTPHDLFADDDGISDEGCFIALCRVLVSRVFKVEDRITASVFLEASRHNYDTIYSEKRDEYVFLKPNHVLPEFLMHVQIVKQPGSGAMRKSIDNKVLGLHKSVVAMPMFEYDEKRTKEARDSRGSPLKSQNTGKLNDWMTELDKALNNSNVQSMTIVEKSVDDPVAEQLVSITEDTIQRLKMQSVGKKQDEIQTTLQASMQHKQNLYLSVKKTVEEGCLKLKKQCRDQCVKVTL